MQITILKSSRFLLLFKTARKQSLLLLMLIAGFGFNSFAQPANDEPCNAIPLAASDICTYQIFSNLNATASAGAPAPGCASYLGGDVWFQVDVTAATNGNLKFDTQSQTGGPTDMGMAIYSGTDCNNLTLIECNDDGGAGLMPQITLTGLAVPSTVWVRVWEYGNNVFGDFGICVKYPGPPPAYDETCNALALPTPTTDCNYQTFTDDGATASTNVPDPGCANYAGGDVWFSVVVPAGGLLNFDTQTGDVTNGGMAIYSGADCNNLTLIACDDNSSINGNMPKIVASSLVPGSTIWIRFWSNGINANLGSFGLCVSIPPPPPVNDDPCGAILLTASVTCAYQTFSTASSNATAGAPAPGCANYQGGDVWFQVVVPPVGGLLIDTQTGVITDGGMAIYSGDCNNLNLVACNDDASPNGLMPFINAGGLTPGSTVWIRIWEYGNDNPGTFGICVTIPPPPPANDEPCNAILLTASSTCNYQTFSTGGATGTAGAPAPGCANYQGGDVWFKVVVPCDGSLRFDSQVGFITDGGMAIYSGDCNNLSLIDCDDASSPNGLMPLITANNLTPGSTIWIRFWEYGNDNPGTFGICVSIPPPPPPGSNCFGAQPFCSSNTYTYPNSTNVPSLGGNGIYGCLGTTPNPAWYYLQVQNPGPMSIFIQQTNTAGNIVDVDFALWGPFPTVASACGNLAANNIVDCSYSIAGTETADLPNGQTGDFYILLITNYSNQQGTVTFNQSAGAGSTSCDILCTISSGNSGPVCACGTVDLTSTLVVGATYQWTGPNCFNQTPESQTQNPSNVQVPCEPGTYIYTVTATTQSGTSCYSADTVIVVARPVFGPDSTVYICPGTSTDLTALYNTTGITTSWTNNADGSTVANPAAVGLAGVYQLIGLNGAGCQDTVLVTVIVDVVTATVTATAIGSCTLPGEITVTNPVGIGSSFTYSISTTPGVFQPANIFVADPGTYTVTTRDSLGCETSSPVTVDFTNDLTLTATGDTTICLGASATLQAISTAASFAWTPTTGLNDPTSATPVASPTDNTTYTVTATLGSCTQNASVIVLVDKNLVVEAGGPLFVDAGGNAQVVAVVGGPNTTLSNILWTPSAGLSATNILNPIVTPVIANGTATYDITITNSAGCTATDQLVVNVLSNCRNVRNAFTPNGDGVNDYWKVYDDFSCLANVTVNVFNRYGSKVYESDNYRNTWDGHYSGKQLPDGTYYAVIEFKLLSGKTITNKTDLTILR